MSQELLTDLYRRGIKLRLTDGRLDVIAPSGTLTPALRDRLTSHRDDLIALLSREGEEPTTAPIVPRPQERHEPFPLTDIQHAYWVGRSSAVELGGVSTHLYFELERDGLDIERLTESLRRVIDRHDMLRAVVLPDGRQRVLPGVPPYEIAVADVSGLPALDGDRQVERTRAEMDHQVLPADRWPLFDIRATRFDGGRLRLHVSFDVLILDGLSLFRLFQDWRRFYEEPDWSPAPLELSYRDHVVHEEAERDGAAYKEAERYWTERLESLPPAPALPLATQPGQLPATRFTRRQARLPREAWTAVKDVAQQRGVTPSAVLMAAFCEVLRAWSSQSDFTLNLTLFNRPAAHPDIDKVIGDFTTLTMLEVHAEPDVPFTERVRRVQQQLIRDLEHLSYSGVRVQRERSRRLGSGPGAAMPIVFTSALVLGSAGQDPTAGLRFFGEQVYGLTQTPQVWLDHQVSEEQGELKFHWDAVADLFPEALLDDMFSAYRGVLDLLCRDAGAWDRAGSLAGLPTWQAEERAAANATGSSVAENAPADTLCGLVEAQARRAPEATAVICGDTQLSYGQLVDRAHGLARRLADLGAAPNTLVGVVLDKGWEQIAAALGVTRAGAAYLPIDPEWPEARRERLLDQGRASLVVTTRRLRDRLSWPAHVRLVTLDDQETGSGGAPVVTPDTVPAPDDLAYVIYTSGSTGEPKGVMIDHRGAVNTILDINARFGVGPADRVLALSALSFDLSVYDMFGLLAAGGCVVMPTPEGHHDPTYWTELVEQHGVTVWNSVPALMQTWVDSRVRTDAPPSAGLRLAMLSGDWVPVRLPDQVRALYPDAQVVSLGGATEASIWSVCYPIGEVPAHWTRIPYGKPLANQTLHVYDRWWEPCPTWSVGEIYIGGSGVARGYWADPERTAERFVVHPGTGERLYRTGDLGRYLPGGDIEFLGRDDTQVKLNGYRIELGEIAAALRRLPGIGEAIAAVDTNPRTGRRQLVAHVVPSTGGPALGDPSRPPRDDAWQQALDAGAAELTKVAQELAADLETYRALWRDVERLCPQVMARTLAGLGFFREPHSTATAGEIVAAGGVKPMYTALVGQWMSVLAGAGMLRHTEEPGRYTCVEPFDEDRLDAEVRRGLDALGGDGHLKVLSDYFARCAATQTELLRGRTSPLQLLLPGGDSKVTDALYAGNPVSHLQNRITARIVGAFTRALPEDRPVRILEVGAGTGATSAEVLTELPAGRTEYAFTDVSTYFTQRARSRFGEGTFAEYGVFDIDREPTAQGVAPGSADIVLAANVMHDAKDLDASLERLRSVLSAGGLLVLVEGTTSSLQQLLTVGFIEGLAQDHEDRPALLSVPEWRARLEAAGYARSVSVPEGEAVVDVHVQHVLVAQAPGGPVALDADRLRAELGEVLPEYMVPRHYMVIDRVPLSANGKVDRSALPSPWVAGDAEERLGPRDEMERQLFAIWRDALAHDEFGVEDNFFELGGDSVHAVSVIERLRADFNLDLQADEGLEVLFDHPTIATLVTAVRDWQERA